MYGVPFAPTLKTWKKNLKTKKISKKNFFQKKPFSKNCFQKKLFSKKRFSKKSFFARLKHPLGRLYTHVRAHNSACKQVSALYETDNESRNLRRLRHNLFLEIRFSTHFWPQLKDFVKFEGLQSIWNYSELGCSPRTHEIMTRWEREGGVFRLV